MLNRAATEADVTLIVGAQLNRQAVSNGKRWGHGNEATPGASKGKRCAGRRRQRRAVRLQRNGGHGRAGRRRQLVALKRPCWRWRRQRAGRGTKPGGAVTLPPAHPQNKGINGNARQTLRRQLKAAGTGILIHCNNCKHGNNGKQS